MYQKLRNAFLALWMVFAFSWLTAQTTNIIQGTIKDSKKGDPIMGAAVAVKGTSLGTVTDNDGKFSVAAPADAKILEVKYIGYKTKEVDISKGDFNVSLEEDVLGLSEVVVTAIGIKKEKRALGYAVQDVSGDDITKSGNPSALSSLSGKIAGLEVTTSSGQPGAAVNMQLRGPNSIINGNQPLMVIDGIPVDNTQNSTLFSASGGGSFGIGGDVNTNRGVDINPDDIESISVLKGAAASALYGIRAANGVILITTKKGDATGTKKFKVDFSSSVTFDKVNRLQQLQDQWVQGASGQYDPTATRSWGPNASTLAWNGVPNSTDQHGDIVNANDPSAKTKFVPYDNANTFFKTGVTTDNSFAISGGTDKGTFRMSLSNLYQSGIIPLSNLNKTAVSIAGETKVGEHVSISGTATYTNSSTNGDLSGSNGSAITFGIYRSPINFDNRNGITNSNTNPAMYINPDGTQRTYSAAFDNPYWSINENPYIGQVNRLTGNVQMTATPTAWLDLLGRVGADVYSDRRKQVFAIGSVGAPDDPYEGQDIEDQYFNRIINSDFIVTLHHELAKDFNGSLFVGNNVYSSYTSDLLANAFGYTIPGFNNVSNGSTQLSLSTQTRYLTTAVYGGVNLDYKQQIYLAFTARNEWSSSLPRDSRSFFFPSVDVGWVFTETAKLQNNKWFPFGKLRASFAQAGNDALPYSLTNFYAAPNGIITDSWGGGIQFPFTYNNSSLSGFLQNNVLGNPNLKPELTNSYEAGLDLRFMPNVAPHFGGFNIDFTFYYSKTTNDIVRADIAGSTGYSAAYFNTGSMRNYGFEVVGSITPVKAGDFRWDMSVTWSKNNNEVLSLAPGLNQLTLGGFNGTTLIAQPGTQYGVIYGQDFLKDASGNTIIDNRPTINGQPNSGYGLPVADPNGAQKVIGNPYPKWIGGWRNTFSWKGLSLSGLFDVSFGAHIWDGTRGALVTYGRSAATNNRDASNVVFGGVNVPMNPDGSFNTSVKGTKNTSAIDFGAIDPNSINSSNPTGTSYGEEWYTGNGGGFGPVASQFIEDASYFRLRELSLSYSFDKKWFKSKYLRGIDVGFIARNVFLITPYKGQDPDQSLAGAGIFPAVGKGLDYFGLPSTRSYGVNLKLHF